MREELENLPVLLRLISCAPCGEGMLRRLNDFLKIDPDARVVELSHVVSITGQMLANACDCAIEAIPPSLFFEASGAPVAPSEKARCILWRLNDAPPLAELEELGLSLRTRLEKNGCLVLSLPVRLRDAAPEVESFYAARGVGLPRAREVLLCLARAGLTPLIAEIPRRTQVEVRYRLIEQVLSRGVALSEAEQERWRDELSLYERFGGQAFEPVLFVVTRCRQG